MKYDNGPKGCDKDELMTDNRIFDSSRAKDKTMLRFVCLPSEALVLDSTCAIVLCDIFRQG